MDRGDEGDPRAIGSGEGVSRAEPEGEDDGARATMLGEQSPRKGGGGVEEREPTGRRKTRIAREAGRRGSEGH